MSSITSLIGVNPLQFEAPTQTVLSTRVHSGNGESVWDINPLQLGVGVLGVAGSNTVAGLAKRWALNDMALKAGAARVLAATTTEAALKAMPINPMQKAALFMVSATTFHAAHRLYGYTVEGHTWQGAALEAEGYLSTLAMFAVMAGVMGAAAKYAPVLVATKPAAFATEYAAFSAYEPLEAGVRSVIHGGSFRDTAAHSFTAKAFVERFAFLGALKAAHPVTARIENHVGHKLSTAQLARSIQNQPVRFASYAAATGGLLATAMGHAEGVMAAAAVVPIGETARVYDPNKPGGFLFENAAEAYRRCHAPELLGVGATPNELGMSPGDYLQMVGSVKGSLAAEGIHTLKKLVPHGFEGATYDAVRALFESAGTTLPEGQRGLIEALVKAGPGGKDFRPLNRVFKVMGDLGLFALDLPADLPEAWGVTGMGADAKTVVRVYEKSGANPDASRSVQDAIGCNGGIGRNPILLFGNQVQRAKYLPGIVAGEIISAFALTEPGSGSDAPGGNLATARLAADRSHYVLNGEKQFITCGGNANISIVMAKVDGKPTAFIVDHFTEDGQRTPGLTIGKEEDKIGSPDNSTCSLSFADVKVPVENLLLAEGKGFVVSLGTLGFGRSSLAAALTGGMEQAVNFAIAFANDRTQGKIIGGQKPSITQYGQIQKMVADAAVRTYASQSLVSRLAGETDARLEGAKAELQARFDDVMDGRTTDFMQTPRGSRSAELDGLLALEMQGTPRALTAKVLVGADTITGSSAAKLFTSETLNVVADLALKVHGGYGYTKEYGIGQLRADALVTTRYEGTSEIQRNLIAGEVLAKGEVARTAEELTVGAVTDQLTERLQATNRVLGDEHPLLETAHLAEQAKSLVAWAYAAALGQGKIARGLEADGKGQFVTSRLADLTTSASVIDSAIQRALRLHEADAHKYQLQGKMAQVFVWEEIGRMREEALGLLGNIFEGNPTGWADGTRIVDLLSSRQQTNVDGLKEAIAKELFARDGGYDL